MNIEYDEVTVPHYAIHKDGQICGFFGSFRFLSNFLILENGVCFEELYFPSVEHAYQAAKHPIENRSQFVNVSSGKAKQLGKLASNFNAKRWNKQKYFIMEALVRQKFKNNNKLGQMLILTDGCHLEEMNHWGDRFWGTDVNRIGENNLGKILMIVRDELKQKRED